MLQAVTAFRLWFLHCDKCNNEIDCSAPTLREVREEMKRQDSISSGRKDYCPTCAEAIMEHVR